MPTLRFPALMKYYVDHQTEIKGSASSVAELFEDVLQHYPGLTPHLLDETGKLRRHFNVFVNGVHVRELDGMDTLLGESDQVILMASAAGG